MAYEVPGFKIGMLVASEDLSAKQLRFVNLKNDGTVIMPAAGGEACLGVLQNKPASGQVCEITCSGIVKVEGDGSIATGDLVAAAITTGKAKKAVATNHVMGQALVGSAVDTAVITVLLGFIGDIAV